MKILPFPDLRQTYDYDCGAKAIQGVLMYYGIDVREDEILETSKTDKRGTSVKGIEQTITKFGLKFDRGKMTVGDVKSYIDKECPVILLVQAWSDDRNVDWENDWKDGHYVVAIGYDDTRLLFEDPSSIYRTYLTFNDLGKRWHDIGLNGIKYINFGIAVYGKEPSFSAKKVIPLK